MGNLSPNQPRSPYRAFIDLNATEMALNDSQDTLHGRLAIYNSVHLYEQAAQVRIKWCGGLATSNGGLDEYYVVSPNSGVWTHIRTIPFWTHVRMQGTAFEYRVRAGFYPAGSGEVKLRVAIGDPASVRGDAFAGTGAVATMTNSDAGGGMVWKAAAAPIFTNHPRTERAYRTHGTRSSTSATADASVDVCEMHCSLFGWADTTFNPTMRLGGLVVEEFIGT